MMDRGRLIALTILVGAVCIIPYLTYSVLVTLWFSNWFSFFAPLCCLSATATFLRLFFLGLLVWNGRRIFDATKLPRTVSLTHWAGCTLAHRGYRSEAQQANKLIAPKPEKASTPSSTPRGIRRGSRDDVAPNPLAACMALAAQTVGSTPKTPSLEQSAAASFGVPLVRSGAATPPRSDHRKIDPYNYNIPENSMLAFIYAHEHGVHGVEVDVSLTKDRHIVVMHDNTVDRTTDGVGEVAEMTLAQIRACRYRDITDQEYVIKDPRNQQIDVTKVPTLEEVIIFCKERNLKLMIETKEYIDHNGLRKMIFGLFQKYDMYEWSFVATFNAWHLFWYRYEYPLIPTCLLYCRTCTQWYHEDDSKEMLLPKFLDWSPIRSTVDWLLWYWSPTFIADWMGVAMVGPHNILISPALITSLTTRGIVCDVWTVNSELEKMWLKSLGCIVTSDRLFTFKDVSPFQKPETAPSIHAAEDFVTSSYYISNSQHVSPIQTPPTQESQALADEANILQSPKSLIGEGSVLLSNLRTESDDTTDSSSSSTTLISPTSLSAAQDRISSTVTATSVTPPNSDDSDSKDDLDPLSKSSASEPDLVLVESPAAAASDDLEEGEITDNTNTSTSTQLRKKKATKRAE